MKDQRLYLCLDCTRQFRHSDRVQRKCPSCGSHNSEWRRRVKELEYQERVREYNKANGIEGRFQND